MLVDSKIEVTLQFLLQLHEERAKWYVHSAMHTAPDDVCLTETFLEYATQSKSQADELLRYQHEEYYNGFSDSTDSFNLKTIRRELMKTFTYVNSSAEHTLNTCIVMEEAMQNAYATALKNEAGRQRAISFKVVLRRQQNFLRNSYNKIISLKQQASVL